MRREGAGLEIAFILDWPQARMSEARLTSLTLESPLPARTIAVRVREGKSEKKGPGLFWLGGFMSDMKGTKAQALDQLGGAPRAAPVCASTIPATANRAATSSDGTIGRWLEESVAVYARFAQGPQVVVGSSMGGWLALLLARELTQTASDAPPIAGMVLIAPAVDFTEELMWKQFSRRDQARDRGEGRLAAAVAIFGGALSDHSWADRGGAPASAARRADRDRLPGAHPARRAGPRRAVAARGRTGVALCARRRRC